MNLNEIREYIEAAGSDHAYTFDARFTGGYYVQQHSDEFAQLICYLQGFQFENYIEIGAAEGGATRILNELIKIKNTYIIDNNQHPNHKIRPENLKNIPHKEFVGDSHSPEALQWLVDQNVLFDFAFIDGDHSYEGVKKDTEMIVPFMKSKGYVLFHDTHMVPDVRRWANEIKGGAAIKGVPVDLGWYCEPSVNLPHVADFVSRFGLSLFQVP